MAMLCAVDPDPGLMSPTARPDGNLRAYPSTKKRCRCSRLREGGLCRGAGDHRRHGPGAL